jgi:class 3 adenylate cyclase/tetratricopeptide (TPR) repeat protein
MAENLDPEAWAEIMNEAFHHLTAPIHRFEGTVARLMGDAVLAFFGAPVAHEDDPQRAVLAGLAILKEMSPFCERIREEYEMDFDVRVGINTGPVVVGTVGSERAMEYTAMGDAVNVAARMEQTAPPGTLQISENTYRFVAPFFRFEALGLIEIKGKSEPMRAYRVLGEQIQPGSLRGLEGLYSPLVGRSREQGQFRAAMDDLQQGRGGIVFLVGEAGLGKSRLITEMKSIWMESATYNHTWTQAQGISYDSSRPYSVFIQHLRSFLGLEPEDEPEQVRSSIDERTQGWDGGHRESLVQVVHTLFSVRHESEVSPHVAEALKRELTEAQMEYWRTSTDTSPCVVVFDDMHWADSASVELLEQLFKLTDEAPLLIICALRPYRQSHGWRLKSIAGRDYPHRLTEIGLEPLEQDASAALVENLLAIAALPDEVRQSILAKAEGNPFFVEELIRKLIDDGAIQRDESGKRWVSSSVPSEINLPDNLQSLLTSRIDRLDHEVRRTVQLASVIGRTFFYRILERIAEAVDALQPHLNTLQRTQLIYEARRVPELEYAFFHELTRDAAYHTILRRQRREFHRRVGETMETLYPDKLKEEAHRLARHFREAGDEERAARYFVMAGDRAAGIFANTEAIQQYRAALDCLDLNLAGSDQVRALYRKLGRSFELRNLYEEAMSVYEEMEALGEKRKDRRLALASMISRATLYATPTPHMDYMLAKTIAGDALALARSLEDPKSEVRALWNLCLAEQGLDTSQESGVKYGERAAVLAREHGFEEELAFVLHDLARAYSEAGLLEQAVAAAKEAQSLFRQQNNLAMLADNLGLLTELSHWRGDLEGAMAYARQGIEFGERIDNPWAQGYNKWTLATIYAEQGRLWLAAQTMKGAADLAERAQFAVANFGFLRGLLSWIYTQIGDYDRALAELDLVQKIGGIAAPVFAAHVHGALGHWDRAQKAFEEVQEHFPKFLRMPPPAVEALLTAVGDIALTLNQHQWLLEKSERVLQRLEASGSMMFLADVLHLRAHALLAVGKEKEGLDALARARNAAERMTSMRALLPILMTSVHLAQERGDEELAERSRLEAQPILDGILDDLPDTQARERFLATPMARELRA